MSYSHPLKRPTSSSVNPKSGTSSLGHVPYVQCQQPMCHVRASSANSPCATSVRPVPMAHPRCPPLRDRRPHRLIPSQERPLLAMSRTSSASSPCATSVHPVPTVPVPRPCVQCQRRIPDARALTRHAPVHMPVASAPPRARAHASALTPVRARETARVGSDTIL